MTINYTKLINMAFIYKISMHDHKKLINMTILTYTISIIKI